MDQRKFSPSRLFKLAKLFVGVSALIGLIWLGLLIYNGNNFSQQSLKYFRDCDTHKYTAEACRDVYLIQTRDYDNNVKKAAILGILFPAGFFASVALYKYLFPANKNKKKKSELK